MWLRKAFCLETGFSSTRICHMCEQEDFMQTLLYYIKNSHSTLPWRFHLHSILQDWYNCSATSAIRTWSRDDPAEEPWKNLCSPLRQIPGGDDPWRIRTDPAHTFAIQGVGSTLTTSSIILLARLSVVPGRSTQDKLDVLYDRFVQWCRDHGKSSSLDTFTLLKFKMKTRPT